MGVTLWSSSAAGRVEVDRKALVVRLTFLAGGFVAILGIVAHVSHTIPLDIWAPYLALPTAGLLVVLGVRYPEVGRLALRGWLAGLLAVLVYDCCRLPFVWEGVMGDFIPDFGGWIFGTGGREVVMGYAWRFLGNGAGMGLAFVMLLSFLRPRRHIVLLGLAYGLWVFSDLLTTLVIFPDAQRLLFELTWVSFGIALLGHVVYGLVLGAVVRRLLGPQDLSPRFAPS